MANKKSKALRNNFRDSDLLNLTVGLIDNHLDLSSNPNTVHSDRSIICHLLNASTTQSTVNLVSQSRNGPVEGTVRYRLRDLEPEYVQGEFNQMLKEKTVNTLPKTLKLAIDYVLIPFYGEELNEGDTVRTRAKQGTTRFFAYASIYVIKKNKRYTLALKYCRKGEKLTEVIDFLVKEVEYAGFQVETLYLDRGFFSVEVINHLQRREIPFIMPCVLRGKSGGIRDLFVGRKSYLTQYTMRNINTKEKATFQVNVVVKYSQGKYGRHGIEYFAYAVYGIDIPVKRTFEEYRKRFGIECSHRSMNTARARTTSKNPVLRLLYVGIGFLLMNLWVYLQWWLGLKRGGRKKVSWAFKLMLRQITRRIEDELGFHEWIPVPE